MKKSTIKLVSAVVLLLGAVFSAGAENWYTSKVDNRKSGGNYQNDSFKDATFWVSETETAMTEFSPEDDYYAHDDLYLYGAPGFPGGSLHIGNVVEGVSSSVWLYYAGITANNGLVLEKGRLNGRRSVLPASYNLNGPMTVMASVSAPFVFDLSMYHRSTFQINGSVKGGEDTGLYLNGGSKTNNVFRFADVANYHGLITVTSTVARASGLRGAYLSFKNTSFPGSIDISYSSTLQLDASVAGSRMTISNMMFRTGSRIIIGGTAAAHGSFTATGSLTAESGVEVYLSFAVPLSIEEQRFILLSAPEDEADFEKDDFVLNASKSDWKHHCHLETTVEDGVKSLVAVFEPLVQQTGSYPYEYEFKKTEAYRASSMTNATCWSDGQVPHGGVHYWTETNLRTPYKPSEPGVFPGKSFTLDGGAIRIFHNEYTITNLIVNGGTVQFVDTCKTSHCERITIMDGKRLSVETNLGNIIEIDSEIAGGGSIWFSGIKRSAGTSSPGGQYVLRKPNLDYMGTICVSQFINEVYIDFASRFQTLRIADGRCLGGRLPELNPAALTLANYSRLRTIEPTVELEDGFNRGVYIQGCGRFFVDSADGAETLVCNWPITMNGAFYKEGDGRLELGGTVSFQGEEAIGDTPRANSNLFFISEGTLVPRRHNCCDGMAMSFAKGTKLVVPVVPVNADLMKYGLYNVKEGGGVAIADTLAVDFDLSASALPPANEFTVGIITVPVASAENLRGKLKLGATTYTGYRRAKLDEISDETLGTVTFVGRFVQDGLSIIVR